MKVVLVLLLLPSFRSLVSKDRSSSLLQLLAGDAGSSDQSHSMPLSLSSQQLRFLPLTDDTDASLLATGVILSFPSRWSMVNIVAMWGVLWLAVVSMQEVFCLVVL